MATYTNQTKNTSVTTNRPLGSQSLTWDDATFTWDAAQGTWDDPFAYSNQAKNTSVLSNQTKN